MQPESEQELSTAILRLESSIERLMDGINIVKDDIVEMKVDISKIKEAVYNPDEGIYARIRALEAWKSNSVKATWIMFTAMAGITTLAIWNTLFSV